MFAHSNVKRVLCLGVRGELVAGTADGERLIVLAAEEEVGKEVVRGEELMNAEEEEEEVAGRELMRGEEEEEVGRDCNTIFRRTNKHS